jgi:hypothetical protein
MLNIEAALFTHLSGNVASVGTRVYPVKLPQAGEDSDFVFPAITFLQVPSTVEHTHDKIPTAREAQYQISAWGRGPTGYDDARQTALEIRNAMFTFTGVIAGITIYRAIGDEPGDLYEDDTETYQVFTDFDIFYKP